ncbi:MAG TPA: TonB-dependent receptor [Steroidobacter sp.]|uniref:TonB-dependent receptor n=1 Tax=Steroidobacter sp. TaxID=1978227 RepID=UPI002ED9D20E
MKATGRAWLPIGGLLSFSATPLLAQDSASLLEEVVVTAQKRSESIQDVPIAVTAITSEMKDVMGVLTVDDLADFTPGLSYAATLDRMSLRGVGRLTNNYGSDPGVATYSDGFYTASNTEGNKRPIIVDRVEVLRGPQGTLYGRNSIGGALNIISKRPTEDLQGEVRATAGSYETRIFEGALSGPITDWLRFRSAGTKSEQGRGYFRDVDSAETEGNVSDDLYVEQQLEFNVGDKLDGWIRYAHSEWNQSRRSTISVTPYSIAPSYFGGLFPNSTFNGTPTQSVSVPFTGTNPSIDNHRLYNNDTPARANLDGHHSYVTELIGHLGWADLKYVGGYAASTYSQVTDYDTIQRGPYSTVAGGVQFTIYPQVESFYMEDKEYYSNELNLISTGDGPLQWIVGLYQYHEQVNQHQGIRVPKQPELAAPRTSTSRTSPLGPANPDHNLQISGALLDADARAVFGQIDYDLSSTWKTTIGVRYTEDNKDAEEFRTRVLFGVPGVPHAYYATGEIDRRGLLSGAWHATTGTAGLQWTPNDDSLVFAKYTRGYKSGGFNAGAFAPDRTGYTEPEFINAYELGVKQTFLRRLTANLSVFHYDYKDAQYPSTVRDPVSNINESRFFNLENAVSQGVELEALWAVTDDLQLNLSYSFLDTEIQDTRCFIDGDDTMATVPDARPCGTPGAQTGQLIDGGSLPSSPKNKIAVNANYTWQMPLGALTLSSTWTYRDEAYFSVFSRDYNRAPSYDETDVRLLWNDAENRYTLIGFVRNAFDQEGYEAVGATQTTWGSRTLTVSPTAPRVYGVEAQFRF